ncbi:P-loop containing nucleoside triphosphate hydrolase protein [Coprinopsis marcescibilis]|uniref:DNA 3'-5' helicase n=1 Tax=Coprinopsis marcescibilis TaxID=230819 RepID=A0A5C3KBX6_COPMA|nr:P-loop containing nucleoside triphosphate hydrolase protein [Coprinopsis marcescibilis]
MPPQGRSHNSSAPKSSAKKTGQKIKRIPTPNISETETLTNPSTAPAALQLQDFDKLAATIKKKANFELKEFQLEGIRGQLTGNDVLVNAGTATGKTVIAAGPHFHPNSKGKLTIMVSPLLALQNEQVKTFEEEFGFKAHAVNSDHGGCNLEALKVNRAIMKCEPTNNQYIYQLLKTEMYQILLISPDLLLSKRFVDEMLRDRTFTRRILSVVVDEAHVISHWGSGFRKKYGEMGMLCAFLPRNTPFVAMSATLPHRVHSDVLRKLEFAKSDFININVGNDCSNVALVVRAMEHAMNTYQDLQFVVPAGATKVEDIPKTMLYADNIPKCIELEDYLEALLPENLWHQGLIGPFSATFPSEYQEEALRLFKLGWIRILICTDAAGMGTNIPDVDVVVQWKLPSSLSAFVQRAGQAARQASRTGLAVLLVEKSAYTQVFEEVQGTTKPRPKKANQKDSQKQANMQKRTKELNELSHANGVNRGSFGGKKESPQPSTTRSSSWK